jgi:hypothetical protein
LAKKAVCESIRTCEAENSPSDFSIAPEEVDQGDYRHLKVSRKIVRKVLRSETTEFHYERNHQLRLKLGPWTEMHDEMLAANEARGPRERLTLVSLFEELRGRG